MAETPKVAHSVKEEFRGANTERIDFYPLLDGILTPISIEHNMRSGQVTVDVAGKPEKDWNVSNLIDAFESWFNFMHKDHKLTLRRRVDEDGNQTEELELLIDGKSYYDYPYLSKDFGKCRLSLNYKSEASHDEF